MLALIGLNQCACVIMNPAVETYKFQACSISAVFAAFPDWLNPVPKRIGLMLFDS